jgi:2-polyprenyl-3-methyl-5-hydroxy-6-metoxy-1,4-benzoquinol methylase
MAVSKSTGVLRVEPFSALADVYQMAHMADYSMNVAAHLFDLAFELEWTGRTLIDLGCGTGDVACWFSEKGFRVTGVDLSSAMLQHGEDTARTKGLGADFIQSDLRQFKAEVPVEMVTCLGGTLNYLPTLRDVETVFRAVNAALAPNKLFFFDLRSIRGLVNEQTGDKILYNNERDLLIVTRGLFNYESLLLLKQYIIMRLDPATNFWRRAEENHAIRGYPIQAVGGLLAKTGFRVLRTVGPDMRPVNEAVDVSDVIIVAIKEAQA